MDHQLVFEILIWLLLHTGTYHYLCEGCKVFECQTATDLLNKPGTEDKDAKD